VTDITSLRFEDPWLLTLLLVVGGGLALNVLRARRPGTGLLFPSLGLVPEGRQGWRVRWQWLLIVLRVAALVAFVVALARPQIVRASVESVAEGIDIVLVLDTSGSMAGVKMEQARKALRYCLDRLNPGDRFGLISFATDVTKYRDTLTEGSAEQLAQARKWVDELEATGGTNIDGALQAAGVRNKLANDPHQPGKHQQVEQDSNKKVRRPHTPMVPIQDQDKHQPKPQNDIAPASTDRRDRPVALIFHHAAGTPAVQHPNRRKQKQQHQQTYSMIEWKWKRVE